MTINPNELLAPRPEPISLLQVGFDPSPQLNDALHRFLLPRFQQRQVMLRTEQSRALGYTGSDNNGVHYHPPDAASLAADKQQFRALGGLPIAISGAELGRSRTGDIRVRLGLQPTLEQRRLLGGFVLGELKRSPDTPVWVYAQFPQASVGRSADVIEAANALIEVVGLPNQSGVVAAQPSSLYANHPSIIERAYGQTPLLDKNNKL